MIEVHSAVEPTAATIGAQRPVLVALIGTARARRAVINRVVESLGDDLVVVLVKDDQTDPHDLHRELSAHLEAGRSVLVDATHDRREARRLLLDIAARFFAVTLAVACVGDSGREITAISKLPGEGWQALVIARAVSR
ncbi:hypothetical protein [Amycolatopsis sp. NPDC059657]|uniref:hypothetical protein n=1 Tax=Amycolatopsis sp. NPDC059657 TaxID=3346899 RepID=UPI00366E23E0